VAGLTDVVLPRRLGPKRASKLRKYFNLSKASRVVEGHQRGGRGGRSYKDEIRGMVGEGIT
jgi:hypothetical protein